MKSHKRNKPGNKERNRRNSNGARRRNGKLSKANAKYATDMDVYFSDPIKVQPSLKQHLFSTQEADSEEPDEKCQCEECLLEERDTPTDLLSPRDYINNQCYDASGDGCQSCQDDTTNKRRSPKKTSKKRTKNGNLSPSEHSQDCGYSSGNNGGCCETMSGSSSLMSSPEGSEVACSEGFCNHERGDCLDLTKNDKTLCTGFTLSLQEMLMVSC